MIEFTLYAEPVSWSASRVCKHFTYNPKFQEKVFFRQNIAAMGLLPIQGYCVLDLEFVFKVPKSANKKMRQAMLAGEVYPTSKDCTNCQKFIEDCLKDICMEDDRFVVDIHSRKRYGEQSQILIKLYGIKEYKEIRGLT